MELGLSLGGGFVVLADKVEKQRMKKGSLDFCMGLGLNNENDKADDDDDDDDNLQLNRQICSSHDERTGLDVNRVPAAEAEEVSSSTAANMYSMGMERNNNNNNKKREFENDAVEGERGSDDIDDEARKKLRLSKDQSSFLELTFKQHNTLNPKQKLALAKKLNLRPRQVEVWFQNRRARTKLKQTEVDCEYLKRCCETLSDENRRLHKELRFLKVKKTTTTTCAALPATTLTICPSCATTSTATININSPKQT